MESKLDQSADIFDGLELCIQTVSCSNSKPVKACGTDEIRNWLLKISAFRNITYSNLLDLMAQLVEHWTNLGLKQTPSHKITLRIIHCMI